MTLIKAHAKRGRPKGSRKVASVSRLSPRRSDRWTRQNWDSETDEKHSTDAENLDQSPHDASVLQAASKTETKPQCDTQNQDDAKPLRLMNAAAAASSQPLLMATDVPMLVQRGVDWVWAERVWTTLFNANCGVEIAHDKFVDLVRDADFSAYERSATQALVEDLAAVAIEDAAIWTELNERCMACCQASAPMDQATLNALAVASQAEAFVQASACARVIVGVSAACEAEMMRIDGIRQAIEQAQAHAVSVCSKLETLVEAATIAVQATRGKIEQLEHSVVEQKGRRSAFFGHLRELIRSRERELVLSGESVADAEVQASTDVLFSADDQVLTVRAKRTLCEEAIERMENELIQLQCSLSVHVLLLACVQSTRQVNVDTQQEVMQRVEEIQSVVLGQAAAELASHIPLLGNALRVFYEFHAALQVKARREQQQKELEMQDQLSFFANTTPLKIHDLEQRIQECGVAFQESARAAQQVIESQQLLWSGRQHLLPDHVIRALDVMGHDVSTAIHQVARSNESMPWAGFLQVRGSNPCDGGWETLTDDLPTIDSLEKETKQLGELGAVLGWHSWRSGRDTAT